MASGGLLSRVTALETMMAGSTDPEVLPKLEELRTRIQSFEEDYESRLAAVQERNRRALDNLAKLQDRVARRSLRAQAEMDARAEAEKAAAEAAAEAAAVEAAALALPKKEKVKAKRRAPLVACNWQFRPEEPPALPLPEVTSEDMQVMMLAVGLETPAYWQRCQPRASPSPFVPLPTPECWDDRGSLLVPRLVAA